MKPFDYFIYCFKNYAKFSGRARRSEFWFFQLFNFVISSALNVVSQSLWYATDSYAFLSISYIYSLAVAIPALAVTVRRLHDTGRSGWWLLAYYLPIVLTVVLFVVFFVQLLSEFSFYKLDSIRAEDLPWTTVWGVLLSLLLSLIFGILIFVWLCTDSQSGTNKYGPNPKGIGNEEGAWRNPYGQPHYGQSPYDQQSYAQNPYGADQPPYGQNPYGGMNAPQQPPYGAQQPQQGVQQPPYGNAPQSPNKGEGGNYQQDPEGGNSHYQR